MTQEENQIAINNATQAERKADAASRKSAQAQHDAHTAIDKAGAALGMQAPSRVSITLALKEAKEAIEVGEHARQEAEEARSIAELARRNAETARAKSEGARVLAEETRTHAESSRSVTETERDTAIETRDLVEEARNKAEQALKAALLAIDMAHASEQTAQKYAHQQGMISKLGLDALSGEEITSLMNKAVQLCADALNVKYIKVLEWLPQEALVRFVSGVGWDPNLFGKKRPITKEGEPHAGYTLKGGEPVTVYDVYEEKCFPLSPLHHEYGIISGVTVLIEGEEGQDPFGILEADSDVKREFLQDDIHFLQSVANVLALALQRKSIEKRLERSNKDLEQFAAIVSHDLKAPVRKARTFAENLEKDAKDVFSPDNLDYIKRLQRSLANMEQLIDDLLAYSKVTQEKKLLEQVPVDLAEILAGIQNDLHGQIQQRNARIDIKSLCIVKGNAEHLYQLFHNLLQNALKYQPIDGTPQITVTSQQVGNGNCEISVQDNGIGFEPAQAERIFGFLERLHNKSSYSGTGIGLATCKRIVERHNGSIWAEGEPGKGSRFIVRLPLA